jgi:hypothetical protein
MGGEIEKFDPAALMQGVRDRIKATFVSLIPDAQWEQMVKKEIDEFFKAGDGYSSSRDLRSSFQKEVNLALVDITKEKIKVMMKSYQETAWDNNAPKINEELKKVLEVEAPKIFTSMFAQMFQSAVNGMTNRY